MSWLTTSSFPTNSSIRVYRVHNIRNRIWPKRPSLRLQLTKTSEAKTSWPKCPWPKRPWPKRPTFMYNSQIYFPNISEWMTSCATRKMCLFSLILQRQQGQRAACSALFLITVSFNFRTIKL